MNNHHRQKPKSRLKAGFLLAFAAVLLFASTVEAEEKFLKGIGYREQELQQAKNPNFASETPSGVSWASFAGGTNIFIEG